MCTCLSTVWLIQFNSIQRHLFYIGVSQNDGLQIIFSNTNPSSKLTLLIGSSVLLKAGWLSWNSFSTLLRRSISQCLVCKMHSSFWIWIERAVRDGVFRHSFGSTRVHSTSVKDISNHVTNYSKGPPTKRLSLFQAARLEKTRNVHSVLPLFVRNTDGGYLCYNLAVNYVLKTLLLITQISSKHSLVMEYANQRPHSTVSNLGLLFG